MSGTILDRSHISTNYNGGGRLQHQYRLTKIVTAEKTRGALVDVKEYSQEDEVSVGQIEYPSYEHSVNVIQQSIKEFLKEIELLSKLGENWDEDGALKPDRNNIQNVIVFIRNCLNFSGSEHRPLPMPEFNACPDGSVDVVWRLKAVFLLLNFRNPEKKKAYFYFDEYNEEYGRQGGLNLNQPFTDDFKTYLRKLL